MGGCTRLNRRPAESFGHSGSPPPSDGYRSLEKSISTWPVAGGVIARGDTVYAAAGIAHYDGTHVVALDAVTGQLKAGK